METYLPTYKKYSRLVGILIASAGIMVACAKKEGSSSKPNDYTCTQYGCMNADGTPYNGNFNAYDPYSYPTFNGQMVNPKTTIALEGVLSINDRNGYGALLDGLTGCHVRGIISVNMCRGMESYNPTFQLSIFDWQMKGNGNSSMGFVTINGNGTGFPILWKKATFANGREGIIGVQQLEHQYGSSKQLSIIAYNKVTDAYMEIHVKYGNVEVSSGWVLRLDLSQGVKW